MPISETTQDVKTDGIFAAPIGSKAASNEEQTINNYKDSYSLAKSAVNFGNIAKITGFVAAGIIGMLGLFLTLILVSNYREPGVAFVVFLILTTIGAALGALFYGLGMVLTISGKNLSASVDAAVQGSPLLTQEQKTKTLNIKHKWAAKGEDS